MVRLEEEYKKICEAASLFEVHVPDPKALKQCRKELRYAKQLHDYIIIVNSCIEEWKTTSWQNINVENMDLECKRMAKEVKALDKDVKGWEIFNHLEATIRNMISSLKSVAELQNPSIRERHWEELMQATKVMKSYLFTFTFCNLHSSNVIIRNFIILSRLLNNGKILPRLYKILIVSCIFVGRNSE
jgi:dynein heavy chain